MMRHGWCTLTPMRLAGVFLALLLTASPALAQTPGSAAPAPTAPKSAAPQRTPPDNRIPVFAADLRGVFASLGQDPITASDMTVAETALPSKAFGLAAGAHVYPWRGQNMALGVGGELFTAGNSYSPIDPKTLETLEPLFYRRLRGVTGQVSLNFGHKMGWSYLTVGAGPMTFESYMADVEPDGLATGTINFGGGARWFNYDHLAFTVDLRFYSTGPALATPNTAARLRHSVFVMSAGLSIK
jgi:hypothetical protein